jgi:hypothetical protein
MNFSLVALKEWFSDMLLLIDSFNISQLVFHVVQAVCVTGISG